MFHGWRFVQAHQPVREPSFLASGQILDLDRGLGTWLPGKLLTGLRQPVREPNFPASGQILDLDRGLGARFLSKLFTHVC